MPRIKLEEKANYIFQFKRKISEGDVNYAGHLGNDRLVSLIQEARIKMFKDLGVSELDLGDGRTGIIIGDLAVNFLSEVFPGDELLIEIGPGEVKNNSMRLFYKIIRIQDMKPVALIETGLIAFDYKRRYPRDWPEGFFNKIKV